MSRATLPVAGEVIKARVASKFVTILVLKVEAIKGHTYIEGVELKKISTTAASEMQSKVPVRLHSHDGDLYVKGNGRTVRPEQVIS